MVTALLFGFTSSRYLRLACPDEDRDPISSFLAPFAPSRETNRAERPGKAKRINIMMDESLIEAIDRIASNRSGFLSDAARMAIAARRETVAR